MVTDADEAPSRNGMGMIAWEEDFVYRTARVEEAAMQMMSWLWIKMILYCALISLSLHMGG